MRLIGLDTETDLMGPGNVNPHLVCVTLAQRADGDEIQTALLPHCQEGLLDDLMGLFEDDEVVLVGHNIAFDLAVLAQEFPSLVPSIFRKLAAGLITDTGIRERLINLSTHGNLETLYRPDGSKIPLRYSLADLSLRWLGIDRFQEKTDAGAWRLRFNELMDLQIEDYPDEAVRYACEDAADPILIYEAQDRFCASNPPASVLNAEFHTGAAFALRVMTCVGLCVDQEKVVEIQAMLDRELAPEKLNLLIESGVMRPAEPSRPHKGKKNEAKYAEVVHHALEFEGASAWSEEEWAVHFEGAGVRMTKPKPESISTTTLKEHVLAACGRAGVEVKFSETGEKLLRRQTMPVDEFLDLLTYETKATERAAELTLKIEEVTKLELQAKTVAAHHQSEIELDPDPEHVEFHEGKLAEASATESEHAAARAALEAELAKARPQFPVDLMSVLSTDGDILGQVAMHCPVLGQYAHRQGLQKLVTTYIKPLIGSATVHPEFDAVKETLRTSSYASKLYPSIQGQNVDPRVRPAIIPRPGNVMCSADYSAIELAAFGQVTYDLFGQSVHRDLINAGVDLHAYLGAQLARRFAPHDPRTPKSADPIAAYREFKALEDGDSDDAAFYGHWRKFAKPVGLGFPGGMGPATMVTLARTAFDVIIDEEMASAMREVWFETYPEAKRYFNWINTQCLDPNNTRVDEDGNQERLYRYWSPLGSLRAGATYCAAANGAGLQTRTAEGAKAAVFNVVRAIMDGSAPSVLHDALPLLFVHDEIIIEFPDDELRHERAHELATLMVESMQPFMPDVKVRAEPALMRRWDKKAKAVYDEAGRLQVWEPKVEKRAAA